MHIQHSAILNAMRIADSSSSANKTKELLKKTYDHMVQIRDNYQKYGYNENINNEWLLVAHFLDRFLFLVYCFIVTISTFTILKTK